MRRSALLATWALVPTLLLTSFQLGWGLTLSQIRTSARLYLRDGSTDVTYQRFSDATLNSFANEGVLELQNRGWLLMGTTTFGMTAGQREYPLPLDYIATLRVTISSRAIDQTTYQELDATGAGWTVASSTPTKYFINSFVSGSAPNIAFYPVPSTTSVRSVQIQYVQQAPTLSADSDVPFSGNLEFLPYHEGIADYVSYRGWLTLSRFDLAKSYLDLFNSKADGARANINRSPNWLPGTSGNRGPKQ